MRYDVDPAEVRALSAGLDQIRAGLTRPPGRSAGWVELGSTAVAEALHAATVNWSVARRRLEHQLAGLAGATGAAATAYDVVDGDVQAALTPALSPALSPTRGDA